MDQSATKTVYLHVGAPTAGAAYLQRVLWNNRRALADQGVGYPITSPLEHFAGAMDLRRDMTWGGNRDPHWNNTWDRIAHRAQDFDGRTVVISQELLGGANEEQVKHAVATLEPAEVHVVFVTRDLAWQLVFDWQEQIKHSHSITFEKFVDDLVRLGIGAPAPYGEMFWGLHDPVGVLGTWGSVVPPERVHVLTLPPPGTRPGVLWRRFCELVAIDPGSCELVGIEEEQPLGVVEAALLRRLNEKAAKELGGDYEAVIRDYVVDLTLAERSDPVGMRLPDRHYTWADERSKEMVAAMRRAGYQVVGDLAELAPSRDRSHALLPGEVDDAALVDLAVQAMTALLGRLATVHDQVALAHLHDEMAQVRHNLSRLLEEAATAPSAVLRRAIRRGSGGRSA